MYASLTTVRGGGPDVSVTARMAAESMLTWLRDFDGYKGLLVFADPESGATLQVRMDGALVADTLGGRLRADGAVTVAPERRGGWRLVRVTRGDGGHGGS